MIGLRRAILACFVACAVGMGLTCPTQDAPSALTNGSLSVTVSPGRILVRNFLGFGMEWEYEHVFFDDVAAEVKDCQ
jgi:hypothetical protein